MSQEFFLVRGCRNSFQIPWDGMRHPRGYPMFHDEINFWMIPNFILSVNNFFKVKIPSGLIVEIRWSWKSYQPDPCTLIFDHWMDKITLMGGGKKLCHAKLCDSSENHWEKYSKESFCMKRLLDFFLMIAMCQKLLYGHENSSKSMRFSDGCKMACGRGTDRKSVV